MNFSWKEPEKLQVPPFLLGHLGGPAIKADPNSDPSTNTDPSSPPEWATPASEKSVLHKTGRAEREKVSRSETGEAQNTSRWPGAPSRGTGAQRGERRCRAVALEQLLSVRGTKSSSPVRALNFATLIKRTRLFLGFD